MHKIKGFLFRSQILLTIFAYSPKSVVSQPLRVRKIVQINKFLLTHSTNEHGIRVLLMLALAFFTQWLLPAFTFFLTIFTYSRKLVCPSNPFRVIKIIQIIKLVVTYSTSEHGIHTRLRLVRVFFAKEFVTVATFFILRVGNAADYAFFHFVFSRNTGIWHFFLGACDQAGAIPQVLPPKGQVKQKKQLKWKNVDKTRN